MTVPEPTAAQLADLRIEGTTKGFPALAEPVSIADVPNRGWTADDLATPSLVLRRAALEHNVRLMAGFTAERGLSLAPHGKVAMAPQLWWMQLDAGAWGICAASARQARVMRGAGVRRILIANEVADPASIRWISAACAEDQVELLCQVDSDRSVELLEEGLREAGAEHPLSVLVELGHLSGRTGLREAASARSLAARVAASDRLRLAGVTGYEGTIAGDRSASSLDRVGAFLDDLRALAVAVADDLAFHEPPIVSAGGSLFFDLAAERLSGGDDVRVLIRPGCYVTHDHGTYASSSPFANDPAGRRFHPAIEAWGTILSTPEPGLAVLGLGRRDVPFDDGYPRPLRVRRADGSLEAIEGRVEVAGLNDHHAFCRFASAVELRVGDVVRCGISHPCTALDKWRMIPVLDDDDRVVDAFATFF